jgi:UDP-3-O-[3-hydroxymyristoyl] glucosamine N-acyltransferase
MELSVLEIAKLLGGEVEGDEHIKLNTLSKIEEASSGALSFLANPKYEPFIYTTNASAVIVNKTFVASKALNTTLIRVDDAYASFTFLLEKFAGVSQSLKGIEEGAFVSSEAILGNDVYVGAQTYISSKAKLGNNTKIYPQVFIGENVNIGENCILFPGVKVYHGCQIADNCIIHSGSIIGSDGLGFAPLADGTYKKIPQTGIVCMEDNVEIGSNCTIDRATLGKTLIKKGVKIDNLVQIAHNVEIGENTVIAAQSGIAGSTKIGKNCVLGGQVGIGGHIEIADFSQLGAQSGIASSIKESNKKWNGTPYMEMRDNLKSHTVFRKLPEILKRIEALEKLFSGK